MQGSFVEGGLGYLVMEKCEGDLLQALNRLPSLTEKTVSYMLRDVLSGLSAIHAAGAARDAGGEGWAESGETVAIHVE